MAEAALSIVVPAHNEATVIGRLLSALGDRSPGDEVIVVCDGCTDDTAAVAGSFPGVTVIEQPRGGKPAALNTGDRSARLFPRFYVDADIVVTASALREVAAAMVDGVEAGAPRLALDLTGASWPVRGFYDVWRRLPYATHAIIGSGVIGLTERGRRRFDEFPDIIGDDEFVRRLFDVSERVPSTNAAFLVTAPRRLGPLVRIKTRSRLGILQLDRLLGPAPETTGPSGASVLPALLRDPRRWPGLVTFLGVRGVVGCRAHLRMWRGQLDGWARDDTARAVGVGR